MEFQIHHIGNQDGSAMFEVIRSVDMKRTAAVALSDPANFPVEGHPAKQFFSELRCVHLPSVPTKRNPHLYGKHFPNALQQGAVS